ncbi:MAG: hypothetical protein WDN49_23190 [Acetobacteraceae bacterium]
MAASNSASSGPRRDEGGLPPADQRRGEAGDGLRLRGCRAGRDLVVHRVQRLVQPGGDGPVRHLGAQAGELQPLHHQPQPQRVPPADIGAPVGVVADPARQDDGARRQGAPAVGPDFGGAQQGGGQRVDGVAAVQHGGDGLLEFLRQRRAARAVGGEPRRSLAASRAGQGGGLLGGQREGGVRGEHGGEAAALDHGLELAERHRAVRRVRPDQAGGNGLERGLRAAQAADIGANAGGAVVERLVPQGAHDGLEVLHGDLAGIHAPCDRQRHGEDRAAERVRAAAVPRLLHERQQIRGDGLGGWDWMIRHGSIVLCTMLG